MALAAVKELKEVAMATEGQGNTCEQEVLTHFTLYCMSKK